MAERAATKRLDPPAASWRSRPACQRESFSAGPRRRPARRAHRPTTRACRFRNEPLPAAQPSPAERRRWLIQDSALQIASSLLAADRASRVQDRQVPWHTPTTGGSRPQLFDYRQLFSMRRGTPCRLGRVHPADKATAPQPSRPWPLRLRGFETTRASRMERPIPRPASGNLPHLD